MKRLLVGLLKFTAGFAVVTGIVGAIAYQRYVVDDPGPQFTREAIRAIVAAETPITYRDGTTRIGAFFDTEHREWTPWEKIPRGWVDAIVASEDGDFFDHHGFSPRHIAQAAVRNALAGRVVAGGSTLTQQTAKNVFYRPDRSLKSKVDELLGALRLEAHFSKEEILEFYANQFHVSANGRGIGIAARYFFDKAPMELDAKECAFLAGFVKAPNRYNPFLGESEERRAEARARAEERTAYVLRRMVEEGTLTEARAAELKSTPLQFKRGAFQFERSSLVDAVERRLEDPSIVAVFEELGITNPATAGIRIVTTFDVDAQRGAHYGVVHALTGLGPVLERTGAYAFVLPGTTRVQVDAGHALTPRSLLAARVQKWSTNAATLDAGGRTCTLDAKAMDRVVDVVAQARGDGPGAAREELARTLPPGTIVRASVRTDGTDLCDLEASPAIEGALVVLEDGQLRAMVGGGTNEGFNRATDARRQLGSTWKPLVYEAALELGWLPTDLLDNRRAALPFRGTWYYPHPDHASDAWMTMSMAGARSENLASVWLLAHLVDRLDVEQIKLLAGSAGLLAADGEAVDAWTARLRDIEHLPSPANRLEEIAFTAAKADVLGGLAFEGHPEDAAPLRSLVYGAGLAAERARVTKIAPGPERDARLAALDRTFVAMQETLASLAELADDSDLLVAENLHASTVRALRDATQRRLSELQAADPWSPDVLALDPEFRTLLGVRVLQKRVAARGMRAELPTSLTVALGAADVALLDMARTYEAMLQGDTLSWTGTGDEALPAWNAPEVIERILDADGRELWRSTPKRTRVVDPAAGAMVGDILRNVVRHGTGRRALNAVRAGGKVLPVAGKTGTTNEYRNAAFVGFAPRADRDGLGWGDAYTVAAWVGYDDNRSMKRGRLRVQGANGPLPAWLDAMQAMADAGLVGAGDATEWSPPAGLAPILLNTAIDGDTLAIVAPVEGARRYPGVLGATVDAESTAASAPATVAPEPAPTPTTGSPGPELGADALEEGVEFAPPDEDAPQERIVPEVHEAAPAGAAAP